MANRVIVATYASTVLNSWVTLLNINIAYLPIGDSVPEYDLIYGYDEAGHILFTISSGTMVGYNVEPASQFFLPYAVTLDPSGRVYATGRTWRRNYFVDGVITSTPEQTGLRIYTAVGDFAKEIVQADNTALWSSVAIAPDGDILITGTPDVNGDTTHRYSPDGTLQWSVDNGNTSSPFGYYVDPDTLVQWIPSSQGNYSHLYGLVKTDSAGNALVTWTTNTYPLGHVTKYDPDGDLLWTFSTYGYIGGLEIDSSDNVYIGTAGTTDAAYPDETLHILKLNSSGVLVAATPSLFTDGYAVRETLQIVDSELHVFNLNGNLGYIRYDLDLVELENIESGVGATERKTAGALDSGGRFYYLHQQQSGISPSSDLMMGYATPSNATDAWTAIPNNATIPGMVSLNLAARDVEIPPLRLPFKLAKPTTQGDLYTVAAALPIRLGIQAPRWILEPSSYGSISTRYRAVVTGSPALVLSISSFQFRWETGSRSLTVVVPAVSDATVSAIQARPNESLILQSGFVMGAAGYVQYVDFFSVPIDSVRVDGGSRSSSLSISGAVVHVASNPQTRLARGISYRNLQAGLRRIRCDMDLYLQPGDTLDFGGETMIVGEISGYASATQAQMEIVESAE